MTDEAVPVAGVPVPVVPVRRTAWRGNTRFEGDRLVPEESAVALTYNRATHAVMLATPADLEDFAYGFSLSEGIIGSVSDIAGLEVVTVPAGIELRMDLAIERLDALTRRQRRLAGPSGCGLCGLDSLDAAIRPVATVPPGLDLTPEMIQAAMQAMVPNQTLNAATRAVHAAGFWTPLRGLVALREDVGRHNALDKLAGALVRSGTAADQGVVVLSSRVSVEMVQKAASIGAPAIVAVSAPTALAIRTADAAGITLIGVARSDGFEVFTHTGRIVADPAGRSAVRHVA